MEEKKYYRSISPVPSANAPWPQMEGNGKDDGDDLGRATTRAP
jgi:hypothetical protein